MKDLVVAEDRGAYALVRIQRPEKRNAMNRDARMALRAALHSLRGTHAVIVLTGTGESFCSGMDLKEYAGLQDAEALRAAASRDWIDTLLDIRRHPSIVISAVNGLALGGGTSLINVSDLAISADTAEIGMPEIGFGTYPAMAGPSTQRMLTAKRAAWLVLTAKRISGVTAAAWGLVNESVPLDQLESEFDALARHVAKFDRVSLSESKQALDTMPTRISEWPAIMEQGQLVNLAIRSRSDVQSRGLKRFATGERNPGQGLQT
jgi:enoyl-CoA hydratase/carnithine racemase